MRPLLFTFILLISFYSESQNLHTESNALSITNESNATTGWAGAALISSTNTTAHSGTYSLRVETSPTNSRRVTYNFPATVGEEYTISIWVKQGAQSTDPAFANWSGFQNFSTVVISGATDWTEYVFNLTATNTSPWIKIYSGSSTGGSVGDVLYIDHVSITPSSAYDSEPPSNVNDLTASNTTTSTTNLSWSASTDNVGVSGYKVYKDGALETTIGTTPGYEVTGLQASTTYNFHVIAFDAAGNESVIGNTVSVTTGAISSSGLSGWTRRQSITINNSQVQGSTTLTNFPMLITLDHLADEIVDGGPNAALNGGGDIRFTSDVEGTNRLAAEVVSFVTDTNAANRKCEIWVKIPSIDPSADTAIYIWYKKDGATQPAVTDAYGRNAVWSDYYFVSHDGSYDSTGNYGNASVRDASDITITTNIFGGTASSFSKASSPRYYYPNFTADLTGDFTYQILSKSTGIYHSVISMFINTGGYVKLMDLTSNRTRVHKNEGILPQAYGSNASIVTTDWHRVSYQSTSFNTEGTHRYNNSLTAGSYPPAVSISDPHVQNELTIGGYNTGKYDQSDYDGDISGIRIANRLLSIDFSDTEYNNQFNAASFATAGTPEPIIQFVTKSTPLASENYTVTIVPQVPLDSITGQTSADDLIENVAYFDGLGRLEQQIAVRAGGNKQDLITPVLYDNFGRKIKEYLPYAVSNNSGVLQADPTTQLHVDYKALFPADFSDTPLALNINPYSETLYENSPLNRVLEQVAPGDSWKKGSTIDNNGHTDGQSVKFQYESNSGSEVRNFRITFTNGNPELPNLVLDSENNGYYQVNELYKTVTKDENWKTGQSFDKDHTAEEFKDKQGRVILKRTYNLNVAHDTYYVYDDFNNLTMVLPPKAEGQNGLPSSTVKDELCYQYKYDNRNRLIEKKIPGKGWESIVYDNLDRPVLTQDANLKLDDKWLFTKYDAIGRVVYTGIVVDSRDRPTLQVNEFNTKTASQNYEARVTSGTGYDNSYYTNSNFPSNNLELLTVNYFDDYDFIHNAFNPGTVYGKSISSSTKGLATGSKVKVLTTSNWITNVTYYDQKARPVYIHTDNEYLGTEDIIQKNLDFSGKPIEITNEHQKTKSDGSLVQITLVDKFEYDHIGRVLKQTQQINNQAEELIVQNTYNTLGQLEKKGVGNLVTNDRLQEIDYTYNVRGWLKTINEDSHNDNDLFNFSIIYNDNTDVNKRLYNGNISQTRWSTISNNITGNPIANMYNYRYDALNRITEALDNTTNYNVNAVSYDKNGNINSLTRKGLIDSNNVNIIDDLSYFYEGNMLLRVTDSSGIAEGFKDGNSSGDDYSYDANGNMTSDQNKGIGFNGITYNYLNLPIRVEFNNEYINHGIDFVYDALGNKQKKIIFTPQGGGSFVTNSTEYAGNFVYSTQDQSAYMSFDPKTGQQVIIDPPPVETLEFFNHAEGYVAPDNNGDYDYIYQYKDHLGNIRLSYSDSDGNGTIAQSEIIEENNYYPFGLKHKGYNTVVNSGGNSVANKFKYNGKELNEELGLDWYDYGARNYDASLGRWMNLDPLAEKYFEYSTYNYVKNNPVIYTDPDGRDIVIWYNNKDGEKVSFVLNANNRNEAFQTAIRNESAFFVYALIAIGHNVNKGGGNATEKALNDSEVFININETEFGSASRRSSVYWNPLGGLEVDGGDSNKSSILSPATVLDHEIDHAYDFAKNGEENRDRNNSIRRGRFTDAEEERVIKGSERRTARQNGETPRDCHCGTTVIMNSPSSIDINSEETYKFYRKIIKAFPFYEYREKYEKYIEENKSKKEKK